MKRTICGLLILVGASCGERTPLLAEPSEPDAAIQRDARAAVEAGTDRPNLIMAVAACRALGLQSTGDVETKFIAPRCGRSECHASVFPPRRLNMPTMIRSALVGVRGILQCKNDFYINRSDPARSYLLAKISATGEKVTCPSGGDGGKRMPNLMPTVVAPRLSQGEIDCLTWWVTELAR